MILATILCQCQLYLLMKNVQNFLFLRGKRRPSRCPRMIVCAPTKFNHSCDVCISSSERNHQHNTTTLLHLASQKGHPEIGVFLTRQPTCNEKSFVSEGIRRTCLAQSPFAPRCVRWISTRCHVVLYGSMDCDKRHETTVTSTSIVYSERVTESSNTS